MLLLPDFRKTLIQSINNAYQEIDFREFTKNNDLGVRYDEAVAMNLPFPTGLGEFIDQVSRRGRIGCLIEKIHEDRKDNDSVRSIYTQFQTMFSTQNNEVKLKQDLFFFEVLKFQKSLFITREPLTNGLVRMINRDAVSLLGLKGVSKSGLSYVRWYLGDIGSELKCYKFLNLRLSDLGDLYPGETISAGHLAEVISKKIDMPFTGIKDFKLGPFLISLEARLNELAAKDDQWLFFMDQFDYIHSPDVKTVLKYLGKKVLENSNSFFLIFSLYKDWEEEWGSDEVDMTEIVEFQSFSEAEIDVYLDRLYDRLDKGYALENKDFKSKINRATFKLSGQESLQPKAYDTTAGPNVVAISKELKIWLRKLKADLEL